MIVMENHPLKPRYSTRQQHKQQQQQEDEKLEEEDQEKEDNKDEDDEKLEEEEEEDDKDKDEDEDVEKLEEEVREIANEVEKRRSTLPDLLESSISSYLSSQRPSFSLLDDDDDDNGSLPGPSSGPHSGARSSTELEADDGVQNPDEVQLLRDKISSNISAIPKGLKRMNDCISRIDKLASSNERIPPVFKRKKS